MEPSTAPAPVRPAPIMDVAPPPAQPVQEPKASAQTADNVPAMPPKSAASKNIQLAVEPRAKPVHPKSAGPALPAAAIACAVVLFAALTALAYYAYTKAK